MVAVAAVVAVVVVVAAAVAEWEVEVEVEAAVLAQVAVEFRCRAVAVRDHPSAVLRRSAVRAAVVEVVRDHPRNRELGPTQVRARGLAPAREVLGPRIVRRFNRGRDQTSEQGRRRERGRARSQDRDLPRCPALVPVRARDRASRRGPTWELDRATKSASSMLRVPGRRLGCRD